MVIGMELVVSNDIRYDELEDVLVRMSSESRVIREDIEKMFHKYVGTMSDMQIKNQMSQVVNYEYNYLGFSREDLASLMANFSMILSEYTGDIEFLNSLKRSVECTVDDDIRGHLQELKSGDNKSFVVVNMLLKNHAFNGIIYKVDDENYKFVFVNKGDRPRCSQYEAYIIPHENIDYIIDNCLGFSKLQLVIGVQDAYNIMESKGKFVEDAVASDGGIKYVELRSCNQKNGNCFYKNAESALLLAWYTAFNKDDGATTPKGPIDKRDMHIKFMENIKKDKRDKSRGDLIEYADKEINVYRRNKEFREYCKKNLEATTDEKRRFCIKTFLDEKRVDELSEAEVEKKINDTLSMIDLETLGDNREVFLVSDHEELVRVVCDIVDKLRYRDFLDREDMIELMDKFRQNREKLCESFSKVEDQLRKSISIAIQYKFEGEDIPRNIFDSVMELNKNDVMFYLLNENFEEYTKDKEERGRNICSMVPKHVMAKLGYICILLNSDKQKEVLDECEKIILENENEEMYMDIFEVIIKNIHKQGKLDYVIKRYNEYIVNNKQKTLAYYGIGLSKWLSGDKDGAYDNFKKASELNFVYNEYYLNFLKKQGELDEVITRSEDILKERENRAISVLKASAIVEKSGQKDGNVDVQSLNYAKKVFTNEINLKYNNEMEYYQRGWCNFKLNLFDEAVEDLNKVDTLEEGIVEAAIELTYNLGYSEVGLKRCGDYLTKNPDSKAINLLEESFIIDLEKCVSEGVLEEENIRSIFEDAVSEDNVDHFSKVVERRQDKEDLCSSILKDVVIKRLCEREGISMTSSHSRIYGYIENVVRGLEYLWRTITRK